MWPVRGSRLAAYSHVRPGHCDGAVRPDGQARMPRVVRPLGEVLQRGHDLRAVPGVAGVRVLARAVSRSECPDLTAADMDQDADRCLARHDDPPPQRVRPAAQSDQDFLRQVSGLVSRSLRRSDGGNRLPPSPCLALLRRHNVARSRFRYANGCGVRPGVHHGMISISDAALVTCDVRTWQGISDVYRDASAGKLNEPLHGADLQNSLSSSGSTVNGNPPGA
jgi:hypothetical protein